MTTRTTAHRRRGFTARCVGGPYAGQTFTLPWSTLDKIHYSTALWSDEIGPLAWINYGTDRHCYQLVSNGWYKGWRLVYRDTF